MTDLARLPNVAMAAVRRRNAAGLPACGKSATIGDDCFIAIGPDEWLVVADDANAPALLARLDAPGAVAVDVSGNRVRYRVSGDGALNLLAAGCALDLERLRPGDAVSTLLGRAGVVLLVESVHSLVVLPRRSFGHYLEVWARSVACSG